jgi:hypothetical protein
MAKQTESPWASGPGEILRHGLDLLRKDTDTNRRLAMISIDNAVELMMNTFLGLPRRITGLPLARKDFAEASQTFPGLLDALEKYAADKLDGIDLGTIEWYHRLRNQLYHQGNGLTVERDKVEIYAALANQLFINLFGFELVARGATGTELLGEFMGAWVEVEHAIRELTRAYETATVRRHPVPLLEGFKIIERHGLLLPADMQELNKLRIIRNEVVHGSKDGGSPLTEKIVERMRHFAQRLQAMTPATPNPEGDT